MGRGCSGLPVVLLVLVLGDVAGVDQVEDGRHAHHHLGENPFNNRFRLLGEEHLIGYVTKIGTKLCFPLPGRRV